MATVQTQSDPVAADPSALAIADVTKSSPSDIQNPGTLTSSARDRDLRAFRRVMIGFALATVIAGGIIGLVPLGLDPVTSRYVSSLLLLVGVGDSLVLWCWDRLFRVDAKPRR
jgi:hypothetical protein